MPGIRHEGLRQLLDADRPAGKRARRIIAQLAPFQLMTTNWSATKCWRNQPSSFVSENVLGIQSVTLFVLLWTAYLASRNRYGISARSRSGSTTNSARRTVSCRLDLLCPCLVSCSCALAEGERGVERSRRPAPWRGLPSPMANGVMMDFHQPAKRQPIINFPS